MTDKRIFKYPLEIKDRQNLMVPGGVSARPVHVGAQAGVLCVWILVDTTLPIGAFPISVVGTGHPIGDDGIYYIGSAQMPPFVWHVFAGR